IANITMTDPTPRMIPRVVSPERRRCAARLRKPSLNAWRSRCRNTSRPSLLAGAGGAGSGGFLLLALLLLASRFLAGLHLGGGAHPGVQRDLVSVFESFQDLDVLLVPLADLDLAALESTRCLDVANLLAAGLGDGRHRNGQRVRNGLDHDLHLDRHAG